MTLRPADRIAGLGLTLLRSVLAEAPADAIHLGIGMSNIDVPEPVQHALTAAPAFTRAVYGPNAGEPALRGAIADHLRVTNPGLDVTAERVIVTHGAQQAIALAILGLVNPGDEVLVPEPSFPVYASLTRIAGGVPVPWSPRPENHFRPQWADLAPHLTERTRMAVVCSPGNPTGATAHPDDFREIAEQLAARNIAALSDEIYCELQHTGPQHGCMLAHNPEALIVGGLAKSHGLAGWRLGWLIVPAELTGPLTALHQQLVTSASTLVQQAALAAFGDQGAACPRALSAHLAARRAQAAERLQNAGWEIAAGDGAFYLWIRHPDHADDLALCRRLMHEARVVTIPGRAFGDAGTGYLRISYSLEAGLLDQALQRLEDWSATATVPR